uniref:Uncharacterized protein n=1 Tax=Corvus moneduloides TaxID=1196302 RepID=A0A8C3EWB1_CORMO
MGGPETPTPRGGTKELSDEACRSRKESPPFLLFHVSFLGGAVISLASFHAYLADLADCENECFPFSWLIFACICSLI